MGYLLVLLILAVIVMGFVVTISAKKNTRVLLRSQARLEIGARAVADIERQGRRALVRNLAIMLVFVLGLTVLVALSAP